MADVKKSKLQDIDTGILNKDACIVLVKTEWNTAIVDQYCVAIPRILIMCVKRLPMEWCN